MRENAMEKKATLPRNIATLVIGQEGKCNEKNTLPSNFPAAICFRYYFSHLLILTRRFN